MEALEFLDNAAKAPLEPYYFLVGDEDFLKRQVLAVLQPKILEQGDPAFALSSYPGDKLDFSTVRNELDTLPFLASRRLVIIQQADPFVTRHRPALEQYVDTPSTSGVLILDVKSLPATTKLSKRIKTSRRIDCKALPSHRLPAWCIKWAKAQTGKRLTTSAGQLLVDLVGPFMGMLDQELAKLATYVGTRASIEVEDVDQLVGRSREADIWKILTAVGEGNPSAAVQILQELFAQNEEPQQILGAFRKQLRELAQTGFLVRQGMPIDAAMDEAGIAVHWRSKRDGLRQQLRHLGHRRLEKLYEWMLEVELGMKGSSPLKSELLLERLLVQLAKPRT